MNSTAQLVVIGAGPGGYVAAFLAADQGLDVTLIDQTGALGGTCLHRGCIPSKAFLHVAKIIQEAQGASVLGLDFAEFQIHTEKILNFKNNVVQRLSLGLEHLAKQRKIQCIKATAKFLDANNLTIEKQDGATETLGFEKCIIATGSKPVLPSFAQNKSKNILTSDGALNLTNIPKTLLVVGGGYIGLEIAQIYSALGSKVTIWEMTENLLGGLDKDLLQVLIRSIQKNISLSLSTAVKVLTEGSRCVQALGEKDGKEIRESFEKVFIAMGRSPNTKDLGLENTKIQIGEKGFIQIDQNLKTHESHIYAIGDAAGEPLLAHKASAQAHMAIQNMCAKEENFSPKVIPSVVYTLPEVAWCGITEDQAKAQKKEITVSLMPWNASARALSMNQSEGLTKVIFDKATKKLLGVGLVGAGCDELIAQAVLAITMNADAKTIASSIYPHPTLSEMFKECAENVLGTNPHRVRKH